MEREKKVEKKAEKKDADGRGTIFTGVREERRGGRVGKNQMMAC